MENQSPTFTNNLGGMGYIPPRPIGNIVSIGGIGYNNNAGGYYNGMYNNYYNPYLHQQRMEMEKAKLREEAQGQAGIWKMLSKGCNQALGNNVENMDEHLKKYDPVYEDNPQYQQEQEYYHLLTLNHNGIELRERIRSNFEAQNVIFSREKETRPDNMSLVEFCSTAGELYAEAMTNEARDKQRNVSKLYNQDQFRQLIDIHNARVNGFKNTSIDDMEVTLPAHLSSTTFQQRRKAFLETILSQT